jgi:hypothetical protein
VPLKDAGRRLVRRSSDERRFAFLDFLSHDRTSFSGDKLARSTASSSSPSKNDFRFIFSAFSNAFRSFSAIFLATRSFSAISFFNCSFSSCSFKICSSFARSFASLCFS